MALHVALLVLLLAHGSIHLAGFVRTAGATDAPSITRSLASPIGMAWTAAGGSFLIAFGLELLNSECWWMVLLPGIVLSQTLIILRWHDARFGTLVNALLLAAAVAGFSLWRFHGAYATAVQTGSEQVRMAADHRITEEDLTALPAPVQRYLRSSNVVGTARPHSMRLRFEGSIRNVDGPWMPFRSVQMTFFDRPTRLFWLDATMKGLPVAGFHAYADGHASMRVKALGMVPIADVQGPELDTAETVTYFNDLCLFAPAALIDERITWTPLDDRSAQATFHNDGLKVSAVLRFDDQDRLVGFVSDDRYYLAPDGTMERRRFRTPMGRHRLLRGSFLPGYGEAVWELSDGPFTYGRFTLRSIVYDPPRDDRQRR